MEPTPIMEAPHIPPHNKRGKRRPVKTATAIVQNMATFIVTLITFLASAVAILSWFNVGPNIPVVSHLFDTLFHTFGH